MTPEPVPPEDAPWLWMVTTAGDTAAATAVQSATSLDAGTVATVPLLRFSAVATRSSSGRTYSIAPRVKPIVRSIAPSRATHPGPRFLMMMVCPGSGDEAGAAYPVTGIPAGGA